MIVKDEAQVIINCLDSVRSLVDYVLIEDTGSTDGTQTVIREYLEREGIPGEVIEEPWRDFAYNRSFALDHLRRRQDIDYALMIDADEIMVYDSDFDADEFKRNLTADLYHIQIRFHNIEYFRPQLVSNKLQFKYKGVLHEFIEGPPDGHSSGTAHRFHTLSGRSGARSKNPQKYEDDAALLARALQQEKDPFLISRYTFYLAQSLRDSGNAEMALKHYLERAELGFWNEEISISLYTAAQLMDALGRSDAEVIGTFLRAYETCPQRAESLHAAMRYCRIHGKHHQGYLIGKHAITIQRPTSGLFLQRWVYDYGLLDEFSIVAYWSGHYQDSFDACKRLLDKGRVPERDRDRIQTNANFARDKLVELNKIDTISRAASLESLAS